MDVIIIVGEKRSKQLGVGLLVLIFFLSAARLLIKRCKKPDSCWSKSCTLILGHAGRTVANLRIKKLASAPLNYIKSSLYLPLPINK